MGWSMGSIQSLSGLHHAAHLPISSPLQMRGASAQKPEHGTCNSVTWILCFFMGGSTLLSTFLLEHCLSLEKAPVLSSSVSPIPPQRQHLLSPPCRWELWATQRWSSTSDTQGKYSRYSVWLSHIASSAVGGFYAPCTQVHWLHRF